MSRHLEILRQAKLDAELFAEPGAADRPVARQRRGGQAGVFINPGHSHDQWQQLVHQLFLRHGQEAHYSLGLASATAGEGTSYVAFQLAAELARSTAQPTLLLEANVYRPAQAERVGVEPDPGVRRMLEDKGYPADHCLHQTAIDQLWLLPAGSGRNGSNAAPDWTGFREPFQWLRERFAGIVVDLPPTNLTSDSLILGPLFDGVVLVVEADLCSREVIENAVARLRRANPNVMGTILNKRKFVIPAPLYRRL